MERRQLPLERQDFALRFEHLVLPGPARLHAFADIGFLHLGNLDLLHQQLLLLRPWIRRCGLHGAGQETQRQRSQIRLVGELAEQAAVVSQRLVRLAQPALALREAEQSGGHRHAQVIARADGLRVGRDGGREITLGFLGKQAALQRFVERIRRDGHGGEGGQPEENEQGRESFHGEDRRVTAW